MTGQRRTVNLDAILGDPDIIEVTLRGEVFELPGTMPMLVPAKLTSGDIVGAVAALVGPDRAEALLAKVGIDMANPENSELAVLMREVYGLDLGESSASARS